MQFIQCLREYIDVFRKPNVTTSYYKNMLTYIKHVPDKIAYKDTCAVTWRDLQSMFNDMGKSRTRDELYGIIKAALKKMEHAGEIERNPIYLCEVKKARRRIRDAMTRDQQKIVEHELSSNKYMLPILLILFCGFRPKELLSLQKADIDFQQKIIRVRGTKTENADRYTFLPEQLCDMLQEKEEGRLFKHSPKTLNRQLRMICRDKELPSYTLYNLRHTFATRLYENGVPDTVIQFVMGHSTITFTKIHYIKTLKDFILSQAETIKKTASFY